MREVLTRRTTMPGSPPRADVTRGRDMKVDIGFIQEVEEALNMDCAPPPEIIAPLAARSEAHSAAWRNPYWDDELQDDIRKAREQAGTWLELEEIHAVQRLRGWHRARHGNVTVSVRQLADVAEVLGNLRHSLDDECDQTLKEYGIDRVSPASLEDLARREWRDFRDIRNEVLKSMSTDDKTCGECNWCWIRRLHIQCCALLDAATAAEQKESS